MWHTLRAIRSETNALGKNAFISTLNMGVLHDGTDKCKGGLFCHVQCKQLSTDIINYVGETNCTLYKRNVHRHVRLNNANVIKWLFKSSVSLRLQLMALGKNVRKGQKSLYDSNSNAQFPCTLYFFSNPPECCVCVLIIFNTSLKVKDAWMNCYFRRKIVWVYCMPA